ncbi:kinase-like protein [Punctularia strigosozonata HHB-11173 SS5]|uniref:kinase-like protein n=1 Tax=Punctularia strigosozonata (strain HHB-11173) TaxID=741275 RepID=UPI0004417441|nr:kinase-like protein [Punctularia strigosozonata HHB-11173 SS5]EIN11833.1 kinase-like protein [Punctularia strigosozonata HHB-11173 SS5]
MAYSSFRPLPTPPGPSAGYFDLDRNRFPPARTNYYTGLPASPGPYPLPSPRLPQAEEPRTTLPGGTLLHKGFYDLLSLIPTPGAASRFLWGADPPEVVAGPRYEEIGRDNLATSPPAQSPTKAAPTSPSPRITASPAAKKSGRRISKDMVSRPMGFVHLVHASDADQLEALLTRWGPDGMGKLGDPRWANPIKNRIKQTNQARAVQEVVSALKPSDSTPGGYGQLPPLRVVNGMPSPSTSTIGTSVRESPRVGVSPGGQPGGSTIRWAAGLGVHQEHEQESDDTAFADKDLPEIPVPPPRTITPSLATLEKAVAVRIYFENLYFPLLRQPSSREQRRQAMERDMVQMQLTEAQKDHLRARWRQNETDYLRERRRKVDPSAFAVIKTIGHGAFGVVSLVRERTTGELYAMKQLRKTDMLRKGQEGHVRAERDILRSASLVSSPGGAEWIVKLFYSFQDRDHLYLVLEYMGGGDLLNLLIEKDVFEEDFTRFYVAEMLLAIEACHRHGFIHRDIKPDNFLFGPDGHIKLSDFGLATDLHWAHDTSYYEQQRQHLLHKHGIDLEDGNDLRDPAGTRRMKRKDVDLIMGGGEGEGGLFTWREKHRRKLAYSVCGTNSYMSPEVIRGHGYTYSCDWWSLGVIMFECLYGYPPFVSNSRHVTRQKILNWRQSLKFPSRPKVSHAGVDLMQQLLCEPEDRLGSQTTASTTRPNSLVVAARRSAFIHPHNTTGSADGAELIKAHPWFRGIDWLNIHRYPAPYQPELRNPADTRHFDDDIPAEPLAPANGAPADATRDPLLRDKVHGEQILEVRKALAFAGFTHRSPRAITYVRADRAFDPDPGTYGHEEPERGRGTVRELHEVGKGRAMSM